MKQKITSTMILGAFALFVLPAQAQSVIGPPQQESLQSFLPVYSHYVSVIQKHGIAGFRSETAPGFTARHGHDRWSGAAAFAQVRWLLDGVQGGKVAVTIRCVTIIDKTAVVLMREAHTYSGLPSGVGTVDLKQTWRQVRHKWELAGQQWVSDEEGGPSPIEYTVSADGGSTRTVSRRFIIKPNTP